MKIFIVINLVITANGGNLIKSRRCSRGDLEYVWNKHTRGRHPLLVNLRCKGLSFWVPAHPGLDEQEFCSGKYISYFFDLVTREGFHRDDYREKKWREFLITLASTYYNPVQKTSPEELISFLSALTTIGVDLLDKFDIVYPEPVGVQLTTYHIDYVELRILKIRELGEAMYRYHFEEIYHQLTLIEKMQVNWILLLDHIFEDLDFCADQLRFDRKAGISFLGATLYDAYLITLAKELKEHCMIQDNALRKVIDELSRGKSVLTEEILEEIQREQLINGIISFTKFANILGQVLEILFEGSSIVKVIGGGLSLLSGVLFAYETINPIFEYPDAFENAIMAYTFADIIRQGREVNDFLIQAGMLSIVVGDNMMRSYYDWKLYNVVKISSSTLVEDYWDYWYRYLFNKKNIERIGERLNRCTSALNTPQFTWEDIVINFNIDTSFIFLFSNEPMDCSKVPSHLTPFFKTLICAIGREYREGKLNDEDERVQRIKKMARCFLQNGNMDGFYFINETFLNGCKQ